MTRLSELNTELNRPAPDAAAYATSTEALINRGRQARAEAIAAMPGQMLTAFRRASHRRQTIKQLQNLSDRMLEDIGISRGQIAGVATQLAARTVTDTPVVWTFLAKVRQARLRRVTIRELEQLSDRVLSDIGISRGQIPAEVDRILEKRNAEALASQSLASQSVVSPVHALLTRLESAVRPLRQWHVSRLAAGQIARLGNATLSDLGYIKGDVDWVPEVMAERKIANSTSRPEVGAA